MGKIEIDDDRSQSTLLGAAGEHYVMSTLLRLGYVAALAPVGVPNADIVVTNVEGSRLCCIQVKTRRDKGSDGGWHMKAKHEQVTADRFFYCLVDFGKSLVDPPKSFVLPSLIVARALREAHRRWLAQPGAKGQQRNDGPMRRLRPSYTHLFESSDNPYPDGWMEKYRDAWHLLQLSEKVP